MMKKFYSVGIVLLLFTPHVFSQTIGINFGALKSNLYHTTKGQAPEYWLKEYKAKFGYSIGVNLNFNLQSENMSIESNLMYANLGANYHSPDGPTNNPWALIARIPLTLKLNYLFLPVLFRYSLFKKFNLKIGPQFGYLVSNKVSVDESFSDKLSPEELSEFYSDIELIAKRKFDFGVNTGLGYILNPKFDISLNFYNGFGTLKKIDCSVCSNEWGINLKNRYLSLSVNYTLSKK